MLQYAELCQQTLPLIRQTGAFIRAELGRVSQTAIEEKSLNSLVSYVDRQAEEQLVQGLSTLLPAAGFLTEEETVDQEQQHFRWIIDPLDGTTNFLFQVPNFAISVALEAGGELVLGVVYEINRDECFYAWQDGGAFLNGQAIRCRANDNVADSLFATGFPYYDYRQLERYLKVLSHLVQRSRGIRRLGAAALDLAYVAAGRFDGFYEYTLQAWDVAAGIVLIREAGGVVTDFSGGNSCLENGEIVAGSVAIQPQLLSIVQGHL